MFVEMDGSIVNTDHILLIDRSYNKDKNETTFRVSLTNEGEIRDVRFGCVKHGWLLNTPVPAEPGTVYMEIFPPEAWELKADNVEAEACEFLIHKVPVIAWKIDEDGLLDPMTEDCEIGAAKYAATKYASGLVVTAGGEPTSFDSLDEWVSDCRRQWLKGLAQKAEKDVAA